MKPFTKQLLAMLLAGVVALSSVGCSTPPAKEAEPTTATATAQSTEAPKQEAPAQEPTANEPEAQMPDGQPAEESTGSNIWVVYFSRTGEQYNVGVIEKGNTAIVAEMISKQTGADLFEILPSDDHYPMTYNELTDVAKREQNENARPAYAGEVPDLSQYSTIFIGAPVWWGDWPMILYTFFEANADALAGKTLIPFSTHEGSGLSGFDRKLASACPNSTISDGLAIRGNDCQNKQDSVRNTVNGWLAGLGY